MSQDRPEPAEAQRSRRKGRRTPSLYRWLETASGTVLLALIILTPWAFGTTGDVEVAIASQWGWLAGLLTLAKIAVRRFTDMEPNGWRESSNKSWMPWALLGCVVFILGWTLASGLNPRANYRIYWQRFDYFEPIKWLPHSYDAQVTLKFFGEYLGLACFFWALRDWLLDRSQRETRRSEEGNGEEDRDSTPKSPFPARMRLLIWVLVLNTSFVAFEGIIQKTAKSDKVLFLVRPEKTNFWYTTQFGPYAYRTNAAQLFNMVWPLALGLWWSHQRPGRRKIGEDPTMFLLLCAAVMAACPIYASTRGGTIITGLQMGALMLLMVKALGRKNKATLVGLGAVLLLAAGTATYFNWKHLSRRFEKAATDEMGGRNEIHENSMQIAKDFPWLGVGPGAFAAVYQLYRPDPEQQWHAYAHNDWLELKIGFGWIGFVVIMGAVALILGNWFLGGGIPCSWILPGFFWISTAGLVTHAYFDFPLRVFSLQIVALTIAACLSVLQRK